MDGCQNITSMMEELTHFLYFILTAHKLKTSVTAKKDTLLFQIYLLYLEISMDNMQSLTSWIHIPSMCG